MKKRTIKLYELNQLDFQANTTSLALKQNPNQRIKFSNHIMVISIVSCSEAERVQYMQ